MERVGCISGICSLTDIKPNRLTPHQGGALAVETDNKPIETVTKSRTIRQVNEAIQKEVGNVCLVKGDGYFYVASEDKNISLYLSGLYSSSIPVCHLNQQTVEMWVSDVRVIMLDYNQ